MRMQPIVVLCFLVVTGIGASAQKAPSAYKAPFTMTISTDHETVVADSKVVVTAHLTNVSDRSLVFFRGRLSGPDYSYRVEIYNDQGKLARYTEDYVKRIHREPPYDKMIDTSTGPYEVEKGKTSTEEIEDEAIRSEHARQIHCSSLSPGSRSKGRCRVVQRPRSYRDAIRIWCSVPSC